MSIRNLRFPLQSGPTDSYFELTQTTLEAIKQNLMLFFATDEGERVVNNQLGSRFRRYLFEPDIQNIRLKVENEVQRIFNDFFPQLRLNKLSVDVQDDTAQVQNLIKIGISYSYKNLESVKDTTTIIIG